MCSLQPPCAMLCSRCCRTRQRDVHEHCNEIYSIHIIVRAKLTTINTKWRKIRLGKFTGHIKWSETFNNLVFRAKPFLFGMDEENEQKLNKFSLWQLFERAFARLNSNFKKFFFIFLLQSTRRTTTCPFPSAATIIAIDLLTLLNTVKRPHIFWYIFYIFW